MALFSNARVPSLAVVYGSYRNNPSAEKSPARSGRRGYRADVGNALVESRPLVVAEKESAIFDNGTAEKSTVLVALERRLARGREVIRRVERAVAHVLKGAAVK